MIDTDRTRSIEKRSNGTDPGWKIVENYTTPKNKQNIKNKFFNRRINGDFIHV